MRYEMDKINGLGFQPVSSFEARAILARFNLTLKNVRFGGIRLPTFGTLRRMS